MNDFILTCLIGPFLHNECYATSMYYLFTVIDGSVLLQMINYIHSSGVVVFFRQIVA